MVSRTTSGGGTSISRVNNHSLKSNHVSNNHHHAPQSTLALVGQKVFMYGFGVCNWVLFLFLALKKGAFFQKPSEKENNDFMLARDKYWNLSKQPVPGFSHEFFKTRNGLRLHYLSNRQRPVPGKDLFVFIHGFPNTSLVWRHLFQEAALSTSDATLVAVDLPGCGASDSMSKYDTQVLECLSEFIVAMRERYGTIGDSVGSTFVVGHDWGCVISMRLAAEAPCLADRFILFNGPLPDLAKANIERALGSSRQIFRQFQLSPRQNIGCLSKAYRALKPVLQQLLFSGYIFVFQLPSMFVKFLGQGGNQSFLRACYRAEYASKEGFNRSESMAANLGPSYEECKTEAADGNKYGTSVMHRAHSIGDTFWHATAYYRDGLVSGVWEKSIETIAMLYNIDSDLSSSESPARRRSSSAGTPLFNDNVKGGLRAPTTVLWGENDVALTRPICLDGLGDYLGKESEIITFPTFGHWLQVDKASRRVLAEILAIFATASGNSKLPTSYIADKVKEMDHRASLMAKR